LLPHRPTSKQEDEPLSAGFDYVDNIFAVTLHIWRMSLPFVIRGNSVLRITMQAANELVTDILFYIATDIRPCMKGTE